jgi:adenylate cyclase
VVRIEQQHSERRLTAILCADVVSYSRLMGRDEAGTLSALKRDRKQLIIPKLGQYHGRVVKLMGDGALIEFVSVVDAVRFAVEVQCGFQKRNTDVPEERRIVYRVGINIGDIMVDGDDIYGDGVNIAARLQELAEPGGICLARNVVDQIKGKLNLGLELLGKREVKNIAEPVMVYRVVLDAKATALVTPLIDAPVRIVRFRPWHVLAAIVVVVLLLGGLAWRQSSAPALKPASVERMALPLPNKPSIVVLPLANLSNDPNQDYFADGITDDLITELSKISGLFVIARNTSFTFKGKAVRIAEVAEELGVRYVLEGSVQRSGERVRINAQLIDALSGGHVWAERFNGSLADVFALQDKVSNSAADALAVQLTATQQEKIAQRETNVPAAYDQFLRGWEHYRSTTPANFAHSIPFFEEAIKLDPNYGRAYAALAMVYLLSNNRQWWSIIGMTPAETYEKAMRYLQEAMKRPTSTAYQAYGNFVRESSEVHLGIAQFKEAIALEPSDSWNYAYLAWAQIDVGQLTEADANIRKAMRLDPHYPSVFSHIMGLIQLNTGQHEEALASLRRAAQMSPEDEYPLLALAATAGHLGLLQDAADAIARYDDIRVRRGDIPLTLANLPTIMFSKYAPNLIVKKGLRLAGVPEKLKDSEFAASNRLDDSQIHSLLFGHSIHGRTFRTGEEHTASISMDGIATISGDWGTIANATAKVAAREICFAESSGGNFCATILRNPAGSRAFQNEYIWLDQTGAYPFSQTQ